MRPFTLAILFFGFMAPAQGSTARRASLQALVDNSNLVTVATVTARDAFWEGGRIYTRNTIQVEEVWLSDKIADFKKAESKDTPQSLELLTLGGVVGDIGQKVSGSPQLRRGASYLLFLVQGDSNQWHVVGLSQGVLQIEGDTLLPLPESHDLHLIGPGSDLPTSRSKLRLQVLAALQDRP